MTSVRDPAPLNSSPPQVWLRVIGGLFRLAIPLATYLSASWLTIGYLLSPRRKRVTALLSAHQRQGIIGNRLPRGGQNQWYRSVSQRGHAQR